MSSMCCLGCRYKRAASAGSGRGTDVRLFCRGLVRLDHRGRRAFTLFSMDIGAGERVTIIAESNEGRTTLVHGLVGLAEAAEVMLEVSIPICSSALIEANTTTVSRAIFESAIDYVIRVNTLVRLSSFPLHGMGSRRNPDGVGFSPRLVYCANGHC